MSMDSTDLTQMREMMRAELGQAVAELELRLVKHFVTKKELDEVKKDLADVRDDTESLANWRSYIRGGFAAVGTLSAIAIGLAGLALKIALG